MEQFKIYYLVDATWDESRIAKVFVERETAKTYFVHHYEQMLGWQYIGKRLNKDRDIFSNFLPAVQRLIDKREASIKRHQKSLEKAQADLEFLLELKSKIDEHSDK